MKPVKHFSFLLAAILLIACTSPNTKETEAGSTHLPAVGAQPGIQARGPLFYFTATDAQNILGEPAVLADSATIEENGVIRYQTVFFGAADSGQEPQKAFYMYEVYPDSVSCKTMYADIKKANEMNGIETLSGMGDEAYFHTDGSNFGFLLTRKGHRMVRMKVTPFSKRFPRETFLKTGERILHTP